MNILDRFLEDVERKYKSVDLLNDDELKKLESDIQQFYKQHFQNLEKEKVRNVFFHYSRSIKEPEKFKFLEKIVQIIQILRPEVYPIPVVESVDDESFLITISHPIFELIVLKKELLPIYPLSELYILEDELVEELTEKIFLEDIIIKNGIYYQSGVIFRAIDYILNKIFYYLPEKSFNYFIKKNKNDFEVNDNILSKAYSYIFTTLTKQILNKGINIDIDKDFENIIDSVIKDIPELNFLIKTAQLENLLITMPEEEEEEIFQIEKDNENSIYNLIYFFGIDNINLYLLSRYFDYDLILKDVNYLVEKLKENENLKEDLEIFVSSVVDLPYISREYKNKDLLFNIIKNTGFSEEFFEEIDLNAKFRTFSYQDFLNSWKEDKEYYVETYIQKELSRLFLNKTSKEETANNIKTLLENRKDDFIQYEKLSAVKFLIALLENNFNSLDETPELTVLRLLYEGIPEEELEKHFSDNILEEITLDELLKQANNTALNVISFYPFEEKLYKIADIKFSYKLPDG